MIFNRMTDAEFQDWASCETFEDESMPFIAKWTLANGDLATGIWDPVGLGVYIEHVAFLFEGSSYEENQATAEKITATTSVNDLLAMGFVRDDM